MSRYLEYFYSPVLGNSCLLSLAIVFCEVILSISFFVCLWTSHPRISGVLEWAVSFVGAFYIWAFVGFVRYILSHYIQISERSNISHGR